MNIKKILFVLVISIFSVFSLVALALAEETTTTPAPAQAADPALPVVRSDTQWVWGEVMSTDSQEKNLTLKYLDYEADQEKNIVLSVDDNTAYENIKSIDQIKEKDVLSVDYLIVDGKNIAKNISLEKLDAVIPEAASSATPSTLPAPSAAVSQEPAASSTAVSADSQPVAQVTEASSEVPAKEPVAPAPVAASVDAQQPAQDTTAAVDDTLTTANPAGK
jgi:biopolymer transport protein ExbD